MDETVPNLRERKTELLDKRNQQRLKHLKNVQTIKNSEAAMAEGIEYFETMFDTKIREIEFSLLNVQASTECGGNKVELAQNFDAIGMSVLELQRYLSSSTFFLSDYKIKMCQQMVNELLQRVEDKKAKLIPKKKFGFKKAKAPATINVHVNEKFARKTTNGGLLPVTKDSADSPTRIDLNKFEWTVADRTREIVTLEPDETNGKDVTLANLQDCVVKINGHPGSLQISNIKNSLLLCGPVARSVFADNCANCKFAFACQQLRLHTSQGCDIYLYVSCRAIIEDSSRIVVAPYNFKYPGIDEDFSRANLELAKNNWADVADFNWLSRDKQSPNWSFMHNDEAITNWDKTCEEFINRKIVGK
jgi:tubulin-specific chaperone C